MSDSGTSAGLIASLNIAKDAPGEYSFQVTSGDQLLFEGGGLSSIETAIQEAVENEPPLLGLEVAYRAIVAGTFLTSELRASAHDVAALCVLNDAKFHI